MVRFILSTVVLAGVLATAHPVLADPGVATAGEPTQVAAPVADQTVLPCTTVIPSADPGAIGAGLGKGIVPVGIGWG